MLADLAPNWATVIVAICAAIPGVLAFLQGRTNSQSAGVTQTKLDTAAKSIETAVVNTHDAVAELSKGGTVEPVNGRPTPAP